MTYEVVKITFEQFNIKRWKIFVYSTGMVELVIDKKYKTEMLVDYLKENVFPAGVYVTVTKCNFILNNKTIIHKSEEYKSIIKRSL